MFNKLSNRFALAALLFAASANVQNIAAANFSASPTENENFMMVVLRAGTTVSLQLNQTFVATDVQAGNSLDFLVRSDVTVNGKVLIAAGSIAEGWVKSVATGCEGKCAEITVEVNNVQAVDGQRVNLRSIPHIIKAPCCGANTSASIGTNLSARVLNDIKING